MIFLFNTFFISSYLLLISADYSYKNAGEWKNENPQCGGSQQSPLDVDRDEIENSSGESSAIKFKHIFSTVPERLILKNDGHTLKFIFKWADGEKKIPYVSGSSLEHKYLIHSFQFRWSSDVNSGSEHQISGKSYPIEMQSVHYNDEYDNYEDAENTEKGILIYSLFYEVGSEEFEFLTKIIDKFPEVTEPGTATEIEPFAMGDVFDDDNSANFFVYQGSLTHPPCYESVIWVVSDRIIPATLEQLLAFQKLNLLNNDDHNNRPLQEINDRKFELVVKGMK
ncbi:GSCOCG00004283001-RA-CDS [Cotesia congregata]|nr:GSCOCG00004283001-RA-CDS [Cotesia congregata]